MSSKHFFELMRGGHLAPLLDTVSFTDKDGKPEPFDEYFRRNILPHVGGYEGKRIIALTELRSRSIKSAVFLLLYYVGIALVYFLFMDREFWIWLIFITVVPPFLIAAWANKPVNVYKNSIQSNIFPIVFKYFGEDFVFNPVNQLSIDQLRESKIVPSHNRQRSEDYVKGVYKTVTFELCEARLQNQSRDSKGNTTTRTVFDGLFILFNAHKIFSGRTVILKDKGKVGNWLGNKFAGEMATVSLEDPVFEKKFEVYGTDQVESRYLLTTAFMQRLLDLAELFSSARIQASFYHNKLLLMIPTQKNFFATGSVFQPAVDPDEIRRILQEMELIFSIIGTLKLHEKTGL